MKIFIYSPQREISQIIADNLSGKTNHCIVFEKLDDLSSLIRSMAKGPDLLILDYLTYNHELFNIYAYLKKIQKQFPVIFYNDPCITRSTRAAHWKSMQEITQNSYENKDFSYLDATFEKLEELVNSKELAPYISLLQPPASVPASMIKDKYTLQYLKDNSDDCINSFRERNKLPNNLYYLLNLLQKNKDMPLKVSDIIELYEKDEKKISAKSLKVLLSRLRNMIRQDKKSEFLIYHEKEYYRFIRYK